MLSLGEGFNQLFINAVNYVHIDCQELQKTLLPL